MRASALARDAEQRIRQAKVALKCPNEEEMQRLEAAAKKLNLCARSIRDA